MSSANQYDVVWPATPSTVQGAKLAKRLDTLEGKVVAELWDWVFKGDIMFEAFEAGENSARFTEPMKERYLLNFRRNSGNSAWMR